MEPAGALAVTQKMYQILEQAKSFTHESIEQPIRDLAEEMGLKLGQVFGVLRIAVTDQKVTPPLIESMAILGQEKTLARLQNAIGKLEKLSQNGASND
jgi:glutamyl-tRNA synthetase